MTAGSPNTPSTSSRSWNATPRSVPSSWKIACTSGSVGGGGGAELKRPGDRVGGGLVGVDGHRRRHRLGAACLGGDVEVLPAEHLGADVGPHPLYATVRVERQVDGGDDVVGPDQGQVAEQDRRRQAELVGRAVPVALAVAVGEQPVHGGVGRAAWPMRR